MRDEKQQPPNKTKVFCIGLPKTGTTSLEVALQHLGYRVTGPNGLDDPDIAQNAVPMALELAEQFDAFQDNPWSMLYREMDAQFPGSRFILSLRDSQSWIRSQVRHFGRKSTPMRQWMFGAGCPEGNEALYLQRFSEHTQAVLGYFRERPQALLVMDFDRGDGWAQLCPFLGLEIPDVAFPHANKALVRESKNLLERVSIKRLKKSLKRTSRRFASS